MLTTALVESNPQPAELKRRGSFFALTLAAYALLLALAFTASIYAYDAHLAAETGAHIEFLTFEPPAPAEQPKPRVSTPAPDAVATTTRPQAIIRTVAYAPTNDPSKMPTSVSTARHTVPSVPTGLLVTLGDENSGGASLFPRGIGTPGDGTNAGRITGGGTIGNVKPPEPPARVEKPAADKPTRRISIGVINGRALDLPTPLYTAVARQARVGGTVTVQVVVDETGKVVSARAVSGPALLRLSAERAALRARFAPTLLSNQPVSVQGIINYNFRLEP